MLVLYIQGFSTGACSTRKLERHTYIHPASLGYDHNNDGDTRSPCVGVARSRCTLRTAVHVTTPVGVCCIDDDPARIDRKTWGHE